MHLIHSTRPKIKKWKDENCIKLPESGRGWPVWNVHRPVWCCYVIPPLEFCTNPRARKNKNLQIVKNDRFALGRQQLLFSLRIFLVGKFQMIGILKNWFCVFGSSPTMYSCSREEATIYSDWHLYLPSNQCNHSILRRKQEAKTFQDPLKKD